MAGFWYDRWMLYPVSQGEGQEPGEHIHFHKGWEACSPPTQKTQQIQAWGRCINGIERNGEKLVSRWTFSKSNSSQEALALNCAIWLDTLIWTPETSEHLLYEGYSESSASSLIMLAHDIRGGCWWYGSRDGTFPPIFPYILSLWGLTWKCRRSEGMKLNSSMRKKWHPLAFTDTCWTFMETK